MSQITALWVLGQVDDTLPNGYSDAQKRHWLAQAEGFCAYLSGKTAEEIGAIGVANGYPTEDALLSSCTIAISGMIAVSVAAATAAAAE